MIRRAVFGALAFVASSIAPGCESPRTRTQVVVTIDAEPGVRAATTSIAIEVRATDASGLVVNGPTVVLPSVVALQQSIGSASSPVAFPVRVALAPEGGDASRRYWIEVRARTSDDRTVSIARVISGYVRGENLTLPLTLDDLCIGEFACQNAETCRLSQCVDASVDPGSLSGTGGDAPDAGGTPASSLGSIRSETLVTKALESRSGQMLGIAVAVDGDTIASAMRGEDSSGTGVYEPGTAPTSAGPSLGGAVVVHRRDRASGAFIEEAFIKPNCNSANDGYHMDVALSRDVLVVGMSGEESAGPGCGVAPAVVDSGAVYVYRRGGDGTWAFEAYLKAPVPRANDAFGYAVDVDGDRIVVGAPGDDAQTAWSTSNPDPWSGANDVDSGAVFVYSRASGTWTIEAHLKPHAIGASDEFGSGLAIEGDRIVVGAPGESGSTTEVDNDAPFPPGGGAASGAAYVYERDGAGWIESAYLKGSRLTPSDAFGEFISLSGSTVAIAAAHDSSVGFGVDPAPTAQTTSFFGTTYVFVVDGVGRWSQQAILKAWTTTAFDAYEAMVPCLDGDVLAISYAQEDSTTIGVDSTSDAPADTTASGDAMIDAGAVFVFRRVGSTWMPMHYLKAPVHQVNAQFGRSAALSLPYLVVGTPFEDSAGTEVSAVAPTIDPASWESAGSTYLFSFASSP